MGREKTSKLKDKKVWIIQISLVFNFIQRRVYIKFKDSNNLIPNYYVRNRESYVEKEKI